MRYRYAVSYESDSQPVETVYGEFDASGRSTAIHRSAREAVARWPKGRSFRSWVIVVERLDVEAEDTETDVQPAA